MVWGEVKICPEIEVVQAESSLETLFDHSFSVICLILAEDADSPIHKTLCKPFLEVLGEGGSIGPAEFILYIEDGLFEQFVCLGVLCISVELCCSGELVFNILLINNSGVIIHYKHSAA